MPDHKATCHCGAVQFFFEAPNQVPVTICNCSICDRSGYQHVFVPQDNATILGDANLSTYTFGTRAAKHFFCRTCGVKTFYIPKSHPDSYSVNLRCVVGGTLTASETIEFDGQNWEKNIDDLKSKT